MDRLEKISQFLNIALGFHLICYILYIRLSINRPAKPIPGDLWLSGNYIGLLVYIAIFCSSIIAFYFSINLALNREPKFKFLIFNNFSEWLITCVYSFFTFILNNIFGYGGALPLIQKIGLWLFKNANTTRKNYLMLFFIFMLPRILFIISLFIDIFNYAEFYLSYRISILLLIPLLGLAIQKTLESFCEQNFEVLREIFIVVEINTKKRFSPKDYFSYCIFCTQIKIAEEPVVFEFVLDYLKNQEYTAATQNLILNREETMKYFVNWYNDVLIPIAFFLENFMFIKKSTFNYYYIFITLFYTIIWGYVLYSVI